MIIAVFYLAMVFGSPAPRAVADTAAEAIPCDSCFSIRVGLPRIVRGPAADVADNRFNEIQLPSGEFRGFDAHGDTRAIDGQNAEDMSGPERTVLRPGAPDSFDSCGQWLNHAEVVGTLTLGFVHDETACRYQFGQTHKSMSIASSSDYGVTWNSPEQIITGTDVPTRNENTGEGDCTVVNGRDAYYYAYCFRARDGALIVARAAVSNPGAGRWRKFYSGDWNQPGLGGDATRLMGGSGVSVARWQTTGQLVLTGWVAGGLGIFFTSDRTTLTALPEPLLSVDPGEWKRPAPTELISYPVLLDARTGANQLSDSWLLVYAYVPPDGPPSEKYLVFREVTVSKETSPLSPQVGVLLARWYDAALHDRWSTTAAIPGSGNSYKLDNTAGYLMTSASSDKPTSKLEDCVSYRPGHPDHLLAPAGFCTSHAYRRLRTAGWVYVHSEQGTQPVYGCVSDSEHSHFAATKRNCDGKGRSESLLGYDLIH